MPPPKIIRTHHRDALRATRLRFVLIAPPPLTAHDLPAASRKEAANSASPRSSEQESPHRSPGDSLLYPPSCSPDRKRHPGDVSYSTSALKPDQYLASNVLLFAPAPLRADFHLSVKPFLLDRTCCGSRIKERRFPRAPPIHARLVWGPAGNGRSRQRTKNLPVTPAHCGRPVQPVRRFSARRQQGGRTIIEGTRPPPIPPPRRSFDEENGPFPHPSGRSGKKRRGKHDDHVFPSTNKKPDTSPQVRAELGLPQIFRGRQ